MPRLEGVLHPLIEVLGRDTALAPLALLDGRPPNRLHHLFAHHLRAGGEHITVNLDRCIEAAYCDHTPFGLTHIHGAYQRHNLEELGVEMSRLGRGLRPDCQEAIKRALGCRQLVFCGYSGRDYFDVDPFFRLLKEEEFSCEGLEVTWIEHSAEGDRSHEAWPPGKAMRPVVALLRDLGADVLLVEAETTDFLLEATAQWQVPIDHLKLYREDCEEQPSRLDLATVNRSRRLLAEGHVYWYMGIGRDLVRLNRRLMLDPRRSSRCAREPLRVPRRTGYEATGRYRRAWLHAWRSPRSSQAARAHRLGVMASTARLHGSFLLAGRLHAQALRTFDEVSVLTALEHQFRGDALIEWLHWWAERREQQALRQGWDRDGLAPFARMFERAWIEPFFDTVSLWQEAVRDASYRAMHPHSPAQLERLRERLPELQRCHLPPELVARLDKHSSVYAESDSIAGYINERRRLLELRVPEPAEVRQLSRGSHAVQDRPGVLKAALLARRHHISAWPPLWSLATVGWSYHLKVRWCQRWLRRLPWHSELPRNTFHEVAEE